ncbi:hypothetical protein BC792_101111 [Sphingobacterium allocomposti]|uniref:Uncharacterized protein n=1 Tax=Sphingobacterium allocomposti TaxID=415956 RepID=A0A5S5DRF1_9SPHI|nr:hypothetical protein BC792_101111 [Sphingobacterium composti Yoo et al. 2007 non Ten et al. 2007]
MLNVLIFPLAAAGNRVSCSSSFERAQAGDVGRSLFLTLFPAGSGGMQPYNPASLLWRIVVLQHKKQHYVVREAITPSDSVISGKK